MTGVQTCALPILIMHYSVIEGFICAGSPTNGSQYAYRELIGNGLADVLGENVRLCHMGPSDKTDLPYPDNMIELNQVVDVSKKIYDEVRNSLVRGDFPIVIGGDHSVAMGSIAGVADVYGADDLSVVYVDGHTDINTEKTTETGYIHGMPLAAAMGLCDDALTVGNKINLYGRNTFIVGARSIDKGEYPIVEKQGVTLYTADDVRKHGNV